MFANAEKISWAGGVPDLEGGRMQLWLLLISTVVYHNCATDIYVFSNEFFLNQPYPILHGKALEPVAEAEFSYLKTPLSTRINTDIAPSVARSKNFILSNLRLPQI